MIQEILVFATFLIAVGYLFTKLVWMPPFLQKKTSVKKSCGTEGVGCGCN